MGKYFRTFTKIAGVTKTNDEGINIQEILCTLCPGDTIWGLKDYRNEFDTNAIKLYSKGGTHIGYLNRNVAADFAPLVDEGADVYGRIREITGGTNGKCFGCNIEVWLEDINKEDYDDDNLFDDYKYTARTKLDDVIVTLANTNAENEDGLNIQDLLPLLQTESAVYFTREPETLKIVKAYSKGIEEDVHIGDLSPEDSNIVTNFLDQHPTHCIRAIIKEIGGGNGMPYTCKIKLLTELHEFEQPATPDTSTTHKSRLWLSAVLIALGILGIWNTDISFLFTLGGFICFICAFANFFY